jgi:hypothetical protein
MSPHGTFENSGKVRNLSAIDYNADNPCPIEAKKLVAHRVSLLISSWSEVPLTSPEVIEVARNEAATTSPWELEADHS